MYLKFINLGSYSRTCLLFFVLLIAFSAMAQEMSKKTVVNCPGRQLPYPRPEPAYNNKLPRNFDLFNQELNNKEAIESSLILGKSILELQQLMASGKLSSEKLVLFYISRIKKYDTDNLNSIIELNPDALTIAASLDTERGVGEIRGPLHGIPVLVKDNIATADKMHTSAGTAALRMWKPTHDAYLVKKLREAGAIILGKANMSEWANYMDPCMPSGFSTNGGQTRNPYGPFDTWGSSSGSAVAVAAEFACASVGSETQGSIIMPAGINSVVALKTSMGLVSRGNIIPLMGAQDVPGPMGKTVMDVAIMLSGMTGIDENDAATTNASGLVGKDFTTLLNAAYYKKLKVGVPGMTEKELDEVIASAGKLDDNQKKQIREYYNAEMVKSQVVFKALTDAGISVVKIPLSAMPGRIPVEKALRASFKYDLNNFLSGLGDESPYPDLGAIISYNSMDTTNRAPYGQGYLVGSQNSRFPEDSLRMLLELNKTNARANIDKVFATYNIDVLASDVSQTYAPAGYPAVTVPSGYTASGEPQKTVFVGPYLAEPNILAVAFAYEQATKARKTPDLEAVTQLIDGIK